MEPSYLLYIALKNAILLELPHAHSHPFLFTPPQLDLFDRVMDEDANDAEDVIDEDVDDVIDGDVDAIEDDIGEDEDEDATHRHADRLDVVASGRGGDDEPRAVTSMRKLVEAVEGDEAISAEVELIADKLGKMWGAAGCGPELWRKVR